MRLRRAWSLDCLSVACLLLVSIAATSSSAAPKPDDEEPPEKLPGLLAQYSDAEGRLPFARFESKPAILLAGGEAPDPRLPKKDWSAQWTGVIQISRPGRYHFSSAHSGPLTVIINGKVALPSKKSTATVIDGADVELPVGLSPIEILLESTIEPPLLKIYWEQEKIPRELVPASALGHLNNAATALLAKGTLPLNSQFVAGRLAVEQRSCIACHRPRGAVAICDSLVSRPAPRLTGAGSRLKDGWIYHWLGDPQALRPEAVMPRLFTDDRHGELERYAVAIYLASQGGPIGQPNTGIDAKQSLQGEQLFKRIGCVVCHEKHGTEPARANISALGQKMTPSVLAAYLQDPLASDPAGRMPGFNLSKSEAVELASYLIGRDIKTSKLLEPPSDPSIDDLRDLMLDSGELTAKQALTMPEKDVRARLSGFGRRVMEQKNCAACHEFIPEREKRALAATPARHDFKQIVDEPSGGCLAASDLKPDGKVPAFGASLDRTAVIEFLKVARTAPGTPAPGEEARLTLERFNCLGCHERDGQGGLAPDVMKGLMENQKPEAAELVSPPPLTGVTGKLRAAYINEVLLEGRRSRPWMSLRMPQFPRDVMAKLPAGLAALDGEGLNLDPPYRVDHIVQGDSELARFGRTLVGAKGFGCTKCHDMLGVPSGGTRGPDLARVAERVNFSWFDRWMIDPQRIQPGTRMPTVFLNGASPYKDILDGDPAKQRVAIWHYLINSKSLPPPEGLETPKVADVASSPETYQCMRTFLPDVTPRSMGIRYPNGVHLAYDMQACRLAYAWSGEFLDMGPVWNDRGGNPARVKGPIFWRSPAGFPWDVTASAGAVPDFTERGKDTALGAALPYDDKLHPTRLDFRGYHLDERGPTFRFELQLDVGRKARFTEQVVSLHSVAANGALRTATVAAPAGQMIWLNAGAAERAPEWTTADGRSGQLDAPEKSAPGDAALRIVQEGKPVVVHLRTAPAGAAWLAANQKDKTYLILRLAAAGEDKPVQLRLVTLSPTNEAAVAATVSVELKGN